MNVCLQCLMDCRFGKWIFEWKTLSKHQLVLKIACTSIELTLALTRNDDASNKMTEQNEVIGNVGNEPVGCPHHLFSSFGESSK